MAIRSTTAAFAVAVACAASVVMHSQAQEHGRERTQWDPKAAAAYLDARASWWMTWKNAARDHGTACVSCHTTLPYALARASLRRALREDGAAAPEQQLFDHVTKRVGLWKEVAPFYADQSSGLPKTSESRGTEAILNAVILATRDATAGRLSNEARIAFDNMWALQMKTGPLSGAWAWLNFKYEPWESHDAPFFGAALAAIAIGSAPEAYAGRASIADGVTRLRAYLQREFARQPTLNRVMALWADARLPGAVSPEQRQSAIDGVLAAQRSDGGWSTVSLGTFTRLDGTAIDTTSDGYATGLVTLVLQQIGASDAAAIARGLDWLRQHQDRATGQWHAWSLNKQRDPASDPGRFMSDAATAYAAMSLALAR